jgi:hypothetical protein
VEPGTDKREECLCLRYFLLAEGWLLVGQLSLPEIGGEQGEFDAVKQLLDSSEGNTISEITAAYDYALKLVRKTLTIIAL